VYSFAAFVGVQQQLPLQAAAFEVQGSVATLTVSGEPCMQLRHLLLHE
jgi:hypothetical protein